MSSTRSRRKPGAPRGATSRLPGRASGRSSAGGIAEAARSGKRSTGRARRPPVEDPALSARATPSGGNIFADLGFPPAEAENLRLRAELIAALRGVIAERELTQSRAAEVFGVTQPRVSDLVRGKIELFSIDALVNMLARAGLAVHLRLRLVAA